MSQLKATHLVKTYQGRSVVDDVTIELGKDIVGILGPNGAGKTTTFYMMVGLTKPTHGQVWLDNQNITQAPLHQRARLGVGYLPQEPSIFQQLTTEQNILAVLELNKQLSHAERQEKLKGLLDEFHITHIRHVKGISLSGGERRRVEIARSLASDPKFILLDEPFAGIDPISVIDIKKIIQHLHEREIGILITDHNVRETLDICQNAYIFNEGKVIAYGTPAELLRNDLVKEVYLGDEFEL